MYCLGNPGLPKITYSDKLGVEKEDVVKPFTIRDSQISNCSVMGIYLHGEGSKQQIIRVKIDNILGPAIMVWKGNYAKIKGCELKNCRYGVQVNSAQPHILMNTIMNNYEDGILTESINNLRCDALIQFNSIHKNKANGILCKGMNNKTRIERNLKISNNTKAGIQAMDNASIVANNNTISGNFAQGVLLSETTYGHLEKNKITANYKANVAFGGAASCDTVILKNEIKEGRAEGIFVIESGFAWIQKNEIVDNADGILLFDATPHIYDNSIEHNQRSGITCCGNSFPRIEKNHIFGNT